MSRRTRRRRIAVATAALGFLGVGVGVASAVPIGTARAASASHGMRVGDAAEAWYSTPSGAVCLPFIGCLPVSAPLPSAYPAGTLHVAVTLGAESARAYVVPALPRSASHRFPSGGTLILPVDSSPLAGTLDAGSAHIKACLTTGALPSGFVTSGAAAGPPPAVDCKVKSPASYSPAGNYFYVDLQPFLAKWQHGSPNRGVALVPNLIGASPTANWHIALDGKGTSGATAHSLITFGGCKVCTAPAPTPTPTTAHAAPPGSPPSPQPPTPITVAAPVPTPQVAPASAVYLIRAKGFRYPAIFAAPLAILAGVIFFSRLFTGTTTQPRTRLTMGAESSDG